MTSFSCPHFAQHRDWCQKLDDWCVPGRLGCVIPKTTVFAVPWQQRLEAKRREADTALPIQAVSHPTIRGTRDFG